MSLFENYNNLFKEGDLYLGEDEISKGFKFYKKSKV